MERFRSVSFGLDLGFSCQGMQDITMFCLVRKQNLPSKLATWHTQILVSLNEEHCAHWIFFAASINHVQFFPWPKEASAPTLRRSSSSTFVSKTTDLLKNIKAMTTFRTIHDLDRVRGGLEQPRKHHPSELETCKHITHLKHKKSIKATMRAPTEIQWPR